MPRLRLPPHAPSARKEGDSGRGRMALQPACALSTGARRSSPLALPPQLRAAPSAAGAPVARRRWQAPGSHATAWPWRQDSETPAGKVMERQRRRSRPRWRVGCCQALAHAPAVWMRGRAAGLQPGGTCVGCHSPRRAPPAQERTARVVIREARRPHRALGVEGPAPC
jgi:hypothetical protein